RRRGRRDALDLVVDALHRRRGAEQLAETAEAAQLVAQSADLRLQVRRPRHARQDRLDLLDIDRLDQVVGGAQPQRLDRALDARVPGDQHDLGRRARLHVLEQIHAVAVGELQVEEDDLRPLLVHARARLAQRRRGRYAEAFAGDELGEPRKGVGIVIDYESVGNGRLPSKARRTNRARATGVAED